MKNATFEHNKHLDMGKITILIWLTMFIECQLKYHGGSLPSYDQYVCVKSIVIV
jgi:hypothetical protein